MRWADAAEDCDCGMSLTNWVACIAVTALLAVSLSVILYPLQLRSSPPPCTPANSTKCAELRSCKRSVQLEGSGKVCVAEVLQRRARPLPPYSQRMTIAMQLTEADALLDALLRPGIKRYVEWGSGGSTELVAALALANQLAKGFHAFSIESSTKWMHYMRNRSSVVAKATDNGLLTYRHGNIGQTIFLGFPRHYNGSNSEDRARVRRKYVSLRQFGRDVDHFDVVLVDGRFRVACAIEALRFTDDSSTILMHDTASGSVPMERYMHYLHGIAPFYETVSLSGTLRRIRPRKSAMHKARTDSSWFDWNLQQALRHTAR